MKHLLAAGLALLIAGAAYAAAPVFNATLTVGKETRFVLVGGDGKPSSFLQIGDSFQGYTLKAYDAKTAVLDLEKDGTVTHVALAGDAAIGAGKVAATPATLADAENVLNKIHFDDMIGRVMDRQKQMIASNIDMGLKRAIANGVSPEDAAAFREKVLALLSGVMDPAQLKTDITKIYTEVFTKDELDGMAAFYTTPLGEAIASKQADVQDKLMPLIQSRMQQMMPKMQQLNMEFQQQQQAKRAAAQATPPTPPAPAPAPAPKG